MEGAPDKEKMNLHKQGKVVVQDLCVSRVQLLNPAQWLVIGNTINYSFVGRNKPASFLLVQQQECPFFSNDLNPSHANLPRLALF